MPNVILAARTFADTTFTVATDAATMVGSATSSLSELAKTGHIAARNYRQDYELQAELNNSSRNKRILGRLALADIDYENDIERKLNSDPVLVDKFNAYVEAYRADLDKITARQSAQQLRAVA